MKIKSITINKFRTIQHATIELQDYSIIVGENNVGKSNIIDAIRFFYGDIELNTGDLCYESDFDSVPWIEIEYDMTPMEYMALPEAYRIHKNKLRVRREIDFSNFELRDDSSFKTHYVYPDVPQSDQPIEDLFGKVIYIPSGDNMQHTYKNIIDKLNESIRKRIEMTKVSYKFLFKYEFIKLERKIAKEIQTLGILPEVFFDPQLSKSRMSLHVKEDFGFIKDLSMLSTGTQRRIIAGLIKINAQLNERLYGIKPTVLLYEEPEAYMHPNAIVDLVYDLRGFAKANNQQVIATTHSGHLVSENVMDTRGIIRVDKQNGFTKVHQHKIPDSELEIAKNLVYLDRPRSDIFFAKKVVLVEGPTEYMLYNYLKQRGDLPHSLTQNVTVIDTIGKWSMPYFQKILNSYNIHHSVLYDTDGDPNRADNIAVKNEFSEFTDYAYGFTRDIETFCGIKKSGNPAINIINKFKDGTVAREKQAEIVEIFKNMITEKQK